MINFDYQCLECGDTTDTKRMDSFSCSCGGTYRLLDSMAVHGGTSNFEPHYSPEVKQMVYSWKDAERKGKAFRSPDHPNGFILTQSNRRFINECKNIKRNKEDFIQETYSKGEWGRKGGQKYKPGQKKKVDDVTRTFITHNQT